MGLYSEVNTNVGKVDVYKSKQVHSLRNGALRPKMSKENMQGHIQQDKQYMKST